MLTQYKNQNGLDLTWVVIPDGDGEWTTLSSSGTA